MKFDPPLIPATLQRRYKRFLADVRLADGECMTVHCPNTGAMTGCAEPGSPVWLLQSKNPKRKYRYGLEQVLTAHGRVGVNTARANALIKEALADDRLPELRGFGLQRAEAAIPDGAGRFDFLLAEHSTGAKDCYVEVKSVTLVAPGGLGLFPDAVSVRALKHVKALQSMCERGARAALVFCVQHEGIEGVAPAEEIDPAYAAALRCAASQGVEMLAYKASLSATTTQIDRPLPVQLGGEGT